MKIELSIVMPCLNEAETIETCITKAQQFMTSHKIAGEVIIGDNGSTDGSVEIAKALGAIVINVKEKGYGSASIGAINAARGEHIITADTDDSHDLLNLGLFIDKLNEGYELVMGNRFKGKKTKGAMPFMHRYIGNPLLTFIGNVFFRTSIGDFHCGLRGFTKSAFQKMNLNSKGMEFASEIVVKSSMLGLKITEVPTNVFASGRSRKPHLRTFPDGWRHLRFLLLYSPKWLFLIPGILLLLTGSLGLILFIDKSTINWVILNLCLVLISFQFIIFFALTKIFAINHGLIPKSKNHSKIFKLFTLEKGLFTGVLMTIIGGYFFIGAVPKNTPTESELKLILTSSLAMVLGIEIILFSFFFSILGLTDE